MPVERRERAIDTRAGAARLQSIHPYGARRPEQCLGLIDWGFVNQTYLAYQRIPTYYEWYLNADQRLVYEHHKRFLQHLQFRSPGDWVLKWPKHLFGLDALLEVYPDARIVFEGFGTDLGRVLRDVIAPFKPERVMIGGGMLYIDDKARGVHEGYLVTPITKLELVMGLNLAGAAKAVLAGISLTIIGSLIAGLNAIFNPIADLELLAMIVATSLAFNGMMFLMMVRVDDPLVPRAMFGVLNTLLFFPSGAVFPIIAFPKWLQAIAIIDPFTYCVHGFKAILLKDGGFVAIQYDLLFLFTFGIGTLLIATPLFKRTL